MRIRQFHSQDLQTIIEIERLSALTDKRAGIDEAELSQLLADPAGEDAANTFVATDDDDELNTWGQAGTLEGVEGEIVGYTMLHLKQSAEAYHLYCQGAVHPQERRRNTGRALLICALNRARILASEFEFEAEQQGVPVYFEALLPNHDAGSEHLALKCGMQPTNETVLAGTRLYRVEL
jgi:GNAT superfamily N-acetyltransferase